MSTTILTIYTLMWPAILAVTGVIILRAFISDWRQAKREGRDII